MGEVSAERKSGVGADDDGCGTAGVLGKRESAKGLLVNSVARGDMGTSSEGSS